jgi:hypothetical protein
MVCVLTQAAQTLAEQGTGYLGIVLAQHPNGCHDVVLVQEHLGIAGREEFAVSRVSLDVP